MRMENFGRHPGLHIYSRNLNDEPNGFSAICRRIK